MKDVAHLARTDLRRFRLLWSIWVLIQVADAFFRATSPALSADLRFGSAINMLGDVLFGVRWLGMIVIVPLVLQEHPPIGSTAFWLTRPISWHVMLGAKLLVLGTMLVALPAVSELLLMLASRVPIVEALPVLLQTILFQALWLFAIMTLASTTSNLAGFALAGGGLLLSFALLINVTVAVAFRHLANGPMMSAVGARSTGSAAGPVTSIVLLCVAAVLLIILQYRTRLKRYSLPTGLTALALTVLFMVFWPWESRPLAVPAWAAQESALQLVPDSPIGLFQRFDLPALPGPGTIWRFGSIRARLSAIESSWSATARLADSSIEFSDGTRLTTAGNGHSGAVSTESIPSSTRDARLQELLGVDRISNHVIDGSDPVPAIMVTEDQFRAHLGRPGTYRGRFIIDLDEIQIVSTIPLEPGATFQKRGLRIVLDQILTQGPSITVRLHRFITTTMFDSEPFAQLYFYLRNRSQAEAVEASTQSAYTGQGPIPITSAPVGVAFSAQPGNGFNITAAYVRFDPDRDLGGLVDLSGTWRSGAELVIASRTQRGSVTRTLVIPDFRMAEPAKTAEERK